MVVLIPNVAHINKVSDMFLSSDKIFQELQLSYIQDVVWIICRKKFPNTGCERAELILDSSSILEIQAYCPKVMM